MTALPALSTIVPNRPRASPLPINRRILLMILLMPLPKSLVSLLSLTAYLYASGTTE